MKESKPKQIFSYKGLQFDSNEQIFVYCWLQQCEQAGILKQFSYHPQSFVLYQGSKYNGKSLLRPHVYTADYIVLFNKDKIPPSFISIFKYTSDFDDYIYIDVKGGFSMFHDASKFSVNQKWTQQKYGIYVYKIQPDKLFQKTFVPDYCRYTPKKGQLRQKYANLLTINQVVQTLKK